MLNFLRKLFAKRRRSFDDLTTEEKFALMRITLSDKEEPSV